MHPNFFLCFIEIWLSYKKETIWWAWTSSELLWNYYHNQHNEYQVPSKVSLNHHVSHLSPSLPQATINLLLSLQTSFHSSEFYINEIILCTFFLAAFNQYRLFLFHPDCCILSLHQFHCWVVLHDTDTIYLKFTSYLTIVGQKLSPVKRLLQIVNEHLSIGVGINGCW